MCVKMCKVFKDVKMFKKSFHSAINSQTPWASHGLCRLFGEPRERPRELSVRLLPGFHMWIFQHSRSDSQSDSQSDWTSHDVSRLSLSFHVQFKSSILRFDFKFNSFILTPTASRWATNVENRQRMTKTTRNDMKNSSVSGCIATWSKPWNPPRHELLTDVDRTDSVTVSA